MDFCPPLRRGVLLRRYKRFLADVATEDGERMTIHCANTGAMSGCADAGSPVWYSRSSNPTRKYAHTLELVETLCGQLVGVHPGRANSVVAEALSTGRIEALRGMVIHREVQIPGERGRFDFRLDGDDGVSCFVEVKSVTWAREPGFGAFPDAHSARARRHVEMLRRVRGEGHRAMLLFCVQHMGVERVTTASDIDPDYAAEVRLAHQLGVEVVAYRTLITPDLLLLADALPVIL